MTPDRLPHECEVRLRDESVSAHPARLRQFEAALRDTEFYAKIRRSTDVRFGVEVKDRMAKDILYVCMAGDAGYAQMDGIVYKVTGPLTDWQLKTAREFLKYPRLYRRDLPFDLDQANIH